MGVIIAWPLAWFLYWIGHVVSLLMYIPKLHVLYPVYNWLMLTSYDIQEWGECNGPWRY